MRQSIIECLKICLADHQPHKLIDINHEIKSMGTWSDASLYMVVYSALNNHPELFTKTSPGYYALLSPTMTIQALKDKPDTEEIMDTVNEILQHRPYQTAAQVSKALQLRGIVIGYKATHWLLKSHFSSTQKQVRLKSKTTTYY